MACEQTRLSEKFIVPGGNIYSNTVIKEPDEPMSHALHELYFGAYQNLLGQLGLHDNLELGLHISVFPTISPYDNPDRTTLYCRMDTIPIYEQEYRYLCPQEVEPYMPHNRKCTLKERLKVLFKGEL